MSSCQNFQYRCTALDGTNLNGTLKPDANGYYEMVLSALEYPNSVGDTYRLSGARKIMEESGPFMRKIMEGNLLGECGHPRRTPGMKDDEFLRRIYDIVESNVAIHISKVWIDDTGKVKDRQGRPVIAIMGLVAPSGPMGPAFEKSLKNPNQNTCLSVRSITDNYSVGGGKVEKEFVSIVGWDWVNEPGLAPANKFCAPGLESASITEMVNFRVDRAALEKIIRSARTGKISTESAQYAGMLQTLKAMDTRSVDIIPKENSAWMRF